MYEEEVEQLLFLVGDESRTAGSSLQKESGMIWTYDQDYSPYKVI